MGLAVARALALAGREVVVLEAAKSIETGIIDSHAFMLALQGDAENAGAMIAFGSPPLNGEVGSGGIVLEVDGSEPSCWRADIVINCAGLHAQEVAANLRGFVCSQVPPIIYAKGNYFSLGGSIRFKHLIYLVPQAAGLGVHLTIDLGGQVRFGPDVEWIPSIDYSVDPQRARAHQPVRHRAPPGLTASLAISEYVAGMTQWPMSFA